MTATRVTLPASSVPKAGTTDQWEVRLHPRAATPDDLASSLPNHVQARTRAVANLDVPSRHPMG